MSQASGNRFALEGLESRQLMSASVAADLLSSPSEVDLPARRTSTAVVVTPTVKAVKGTTPLTGAFNVAGTYTQPFGNPDAGPIFRLTGSGRKRSLGSFTMTGDLHGIGFVAQGRVRGYVTLKSSQGTIDLRLLGPEQPPGPLPSTLAFKIVNGSGAYAQAYGKGAILVSASDVTQKFVFRFNQA
jgi:hypothetical protein